MKKRSAKTRQQVANEYGISRRTFYDWLKKAGIELKDGLLTPKELDIIYQRFGDPEKSQQT